MTLEAALDASLIHAAINVTGTHDVVVLQQHTQGHLVLARDDTGHWRPPGVYYAVALGLDITAWTPLDHLPEELA